MIVLDTHGWVRWLEGRTDPQPASVVQSLTLDRAILAYPEAQDILVRS